MSTRRNIEKVLRSKSITAESICYDGAGRGEYGWWTITLSEQSKRDCQRLLNEPEFGRHIEFCELDEGFQQLSELPDCLAKDLNQSFPLPDWAVSLSDGTLQVGLQLCTKDGRRCGNGHIVDFEQKNYQCVDGSVPIYAVLTDAGNTLHLMESEIDELFYRSQFVSDPAEVISKFSRNTKS